MASQEGVEIILKATDQYTATINKIAASNELFGKSVKNIEKEIAALETYMVKLVTAGIKPTSGAIKLLQTNLDQLKTSLVQTQNAANGATGAIAGSANNLKKSNQNWTALSLVVQDLPYGFRGIQNNLPALLGGIAGIGGAAYLAFSAVIATLTALDSGLISFGKKVKLATDYNKEFAESLAEQKVKLDSLYSVATNANKSMDDRISAAKKLKEEYPKLLENFSAEDIAAGKAATAYNKLSAAVVKYAKAQAAQTAIKEIVTKQIENDLKIAQKELEYKDASASADKRQEEIDKKSLIYAAGTLNLERVRASTIYDNLVGLKAQNKELDIQLSKFKDIYDANASFELDNTGKGGKTPTDKPTVSKYNEQLAQEEYNFYKDSIFRAEQYFKNLNNIQKINALMEATIRGATADELFTIQKTYEQKELNFLKDLENRKFAIRQQSEERQKQLTDSANKDKLDGQVLYTNNYIKTLDAQLKAELRLHKGNVTFQQEDIKNKINQLKFAQVFAAGNVKAMEAINAALLQLNGTLTGVGTNWANTANKILSITNDFLINSFTSLGESIGKALAGEKVQPFVALAELLASSLIDLGKALISFAILEGLALTALKDPTKWPLALAAGVAAVAAGSFLKAKLGKDKTQKFANGGIISGPTMGLMGEYPGAANNPEVVAPLDKLKDMIGGGGGTLEARISGNDLLILMNKANRNNQNTF
jgi:FtsZ-binding cell division protein ZapB